jgi:hypothetical protein
VELLPPLLLLAPVLLLAPDPSLLGVRLKQLAPQASSGTSSDNCQRRTISNRTPREPRSAM